MLTHARSVMLVLALVPLAGCITWHRAPEALRPDLGPRERREIWVRTQRAVVRGIELRGDTLRAIPVVERGQCDGCTIQWLMTAIDSVRVPKADLGKTAKRGGLLLVILGVAYIVRLLNPPDESR